MELYTNVSYELSRRLTLRYSSSFGLSSRLFARSIRADIYAIYGLVRIADEIVDTYSGEGKRELLDSLEAETYSAVARGYSTNPVVQAFAKTAARYHIDASLIAPFFESMRMDLQPALYTDELYERYIYGSAEVIGLMCLRVFCHNTDAQYPTLIDGARALGAAYQKVNFLRDIKADNVELGRTYFPGVDYDTFSETDKLAIIDSIEADFTAAQANLRQLPSNSKAAVMVSAAYYRRLLMQLRQTPVAVIKQQRVRVNPLVKLWLLIVVGLRYKVTG